MLVYLVLGRYGATNGRADGAELVVLGHALARLALHRERGDARQLPGVLHPVRVERRHVVHPRAERLVRIRRSNARPLQPWRVVLLAHHLLIGHIASLLHDIVLLNHVICLHIVGVLY